MKKYFDGKTHKGFYAFLSSRLLLRIVGGLLGVFGPIFIYEVAGESVETVLFFGGIGGFILLFLMPIGMQFVNKVGFIAALQISALVGGLYHFLYYLTDKFSVDSVLFISIAILLLALYRTLYWIPFHTEFLKLSDAKNRGRQVSFFEAMSLLLSIFMPACAAFLITRFGYDMVFIIAVVIMILSAMPYRMLPKISDKFTWSVAHTWKQLYKHKNTKMAHSFVAVGAESIIGLFIWPIFLYQVFDGNLLDVGIISTIIIAVTVILQLVLGKYIDAFHKGDKVLEVGSVLYSIGWVAKMFVITAADVFFTGAYHSFSRIATATPMGSIHYDMSSRQDDYVDEYNVLREMYISVGRVLAMVIGLVLLQFFALKWLFVIGAVASLSFHLTSSKDMLLRHPMRRAGIH